VISVINSGLIFTNAGRPTMSELGKWLQDEAKVTPEPLLLIRASVGVPLSVLADIAGVARKAGFETLCAMEEAGSRPDAKVGR
jgi:hypothetical protein